jgi:hypothetical protein
MQVFNVRQFGAMGDGITDDTRAIQQAIDAASQMIDSGGHIVDPWGKGGIVALPSGNFRIRGRLHFHKQSGIQFVGAGAFWRDERDSPVPPAGPRTSLFWDPLTTDDVMIWTAAGS